MQCRFAHPLKQPWSGQSNTGSMQIFDVHEFAPPSSVLAGGGGRLKPPSGSVIGGSTKPPDELLDEEVLPPSSLSDASSEGVVASSLPGSTAESSSPTGVTPEPLPLPEPPPLLLEVHLAPEQVPEEPPLLLNPPGDVESPPLAHPPATTMPKASAAKAAKRELRGVPATGATV
jgi:hypothetical protein